MLRFLSKLEDNDPYRLRLIGAGAIIGAPPDYYQEQLERRVRSFKRLSPDEQGRHAAGLQLEDMKRLVETHHKLQQEAKQGER